MKLQNMLSDFSNFDSQKNQCKNGPKLPTKNQKRGLTIHFWFVVFLLGFSFSSQAQLPVVDGDYCTADDPAFNASDPCNDTPTGTADMGDSYFYADGDVLYVGWQRCATGAGTSRYTLRFDADCDGDIDGVAYVLWSAIGSNCTESVELIAEGVTSGNTQVIGTGFQGSPDCPTGTNCPEAGKFLEFSLDATILLDLLTDWGDVSACNCGLIELKDAVTLAGGSLTSAPKDEFSTFNFDFEAGTPNVGCEVISTTPVSCIGGSNGEFEVQGIGGTPPYTFSLDQINYQSSGTFTGLTAGTYTIYTLDDIGCPSQCDVTVIEPDAVLDCQINGSTNVACAGESTGSLEVEGLGGVAPYQYSLNGGSFQSSGSFSNLAAGNYTITILDDYGCQINCSNITITEPSSSVSCSQVGSTTNVSCLGGSDGAFEVVGAGGTSPYEYSLDGAAYVSSGSYSGLTAGTYVVTIRDANGCTVNCSSITVTEPSSSLSCSQIGSVTDVSCFGGNDGAFEVVGEGGTSPYEYSLDGAAYVTSGSYSGLSAGSYIVSVRDANGCMISCGSITIGQPSTGVSCSQVGSTTSVSCFGASDGAFEVVGSGGTSPYEYSLDGAAYVSSGSYSGLSAGTYTVTIRDGNGCTVDCSSITVSQPTASLSCSQVGSTTNVSCTGGSDGSFEVVGSGGTSPYQYSLDGGAYGSSGSYSGLSAGTYNVTIQDAEGCTIDCSSITVSQPTSSLSCSQVGGTTNVSCFGGSDGAFEVTGSGGTNPIEYSLDGGPYVSSGSFSGLSAGTYTVTIRDGNGCSVDCSSITVSEPSSSLSCSQVGSTTNVSCFGGSDGGFEVAGSGGTSPYEYSLDGVSYVSSGSYSGLSAGSYTVTIRDAEGCTIDCSSITVSEPSSGLTCSQVGSTTNVSCFGASDGAFEVVGSGGTSPYEYSLDGGSYVSNGSFSGLNAGTYNVTIRDAQGCTVDCSSITISQPPSSLSCSQVGSTTNVSCFGGSDGSFEVAGSGGTSPYEYSLDGGTYQSGGLFTSLSSGSYTVTIRDALGCTIDCSSIFVGQPPASLACSQVGSTTNVSCFGGSDGSFTVIGSGGTSPYEYSLNGGTYQTGGTFSGLSAGSYNVRIRDVNGCTIDCSSITISQPPSSLSCSQVGSTINVSCFGGSDGSFEVLGSGGTAPYEYSLDGGSYQGSGSFSSLSAGTYTVTIRDSNGCTVDCSSITVSQPTASLSCSQVGSTTNVSCTGASDGAFEVVGSGGTSPYQYSLDGGAYGSSGSFSGLSAGTYNVTIQDAQGCTIDCSSITVTQPTSSLSCSQVGGTTNVSCFGGSDGGFEVTGSGGTNPIEYSLDGGPYVSSGSFSGLSAGTYTVTIRDGNGCSVDCSSITVSEPSASLSCSQVGNTTNVSCFGGSDGSFEVVGSGGTAPYEYSIDGAAYVSSGNYSGLSAGSYTVTIRDAQGCTIDCSSITITEPSSSLSCSQVGSTTNVSCFGGSDGSFEVVGSGGTSPYEYILDGGSYVSSGSFSGLNAGTYNVTIRDAQGCTVDCSSISISQPPSSLSCSQVGSTTNVSCFGNNDGAFEVVGSGGTSPYEYSLDGAGYVSSGSYSGLIAGTYTVTIRDANGCTIDCGSITVTEPAGNLGCSQVGSTTNVSCFGGSDGAFEVIGTGGTSPYEYSLDGAAYVSSGSYSGLTAGTYTVTVRDANGCTIDCGSITVTEPAGNLSCSQVGSTTDVSCFGASDGAFEVVGSGGTSPYEYSLDGAGYVSSGSYNGLAAGTYTVSIRDANGCTIDCSSITVSQPTASLSCNQVGSTTNVSCFGGTDGAFEVTGTGGTAPYQYSINFGPYVNTGSATNLSAGTYFITVRDANGCTVDCSNITVSQPPSGVSCSQVGSTTNVSCFGANDGAFEVTGVGGTAPYLYQLNGGGFSTSGSFSNLTAGTYTVAVRDANGCTIVCNSITITAPPASVSCSQVGSTTNVSCFGGSDGSFAVTASGGTSPYEYSLDGGAYGTSGNFNGLSAGTYTVTIRDANGCSIDCSSITVTEPVGNLSCSQVGSTIDVLCFGGNDGSFEVVGQGGTAPYEYSINFGPFGSSGSFTNLTAGAYFVSIRDANGCTVDCSTITVDQPSANLTCSQVGSTVDVSCFGGNDGSFEVVASGGTAPYLYQLNGGGFATSGLYTGLISGTYDVTIRDANGCIVNCNSIVIDEPTEALSCSLRGGIKAVSCDGGNNGEFTVEGSGGTAPYEFSIDGVNFQSSGTFSNLAAGAYTVTIRDANNCITTCGPYSVTKPNSIKCNSGGPVTDVSCFGGSDGSFSVSASGGTAPYEYSLDGINYVSSGVFSNVTAGTYTVLIRDANGCESACSDITITEPSAPLACTQVGTTTDVSCSGGSDGAFEVSASGGTTQYSFSLDGITFQNNGSFSGLTAGTYVVTIRDGNGCTVDCSSITVNEPAASLTCSQVGSTINVSCFGASDGEFEVVGSGGTAPYLYQLDGGGFMTTGLYTGLTAGTYNVSIRDANGCTVDCASITVSQPAGSISCSQVGPTVDVSCFGASDGSFEVVGSGGTSPYEYSVNGGTYQSSGAFSGLGSGTYTVNVRDVNGCSIDCSTIIVNEPSASLSCSLVGTTTDVSCFGGNDGAFEITGNGGTAPYEYSINFGPFVSSGVFTNLSAGSYFITIRDANGCSVDCSPVTISQPPSNLACTQIGVTTDVSCFGGSDGSFEVVASGGTGPYLYQLNGGGFFTSGSFTGLIAADYTITIRDANGCTVDCTTITVSEPAASLGCELVEVNDASYFGGSDGSLEVVGTGGTSPYQYSLNGGAPSTSGLFTGLAAGTYNVSIIDAKGCSVNCATITVSEPPELFCNLNGEVVNVTCFGASDGSFEVFGSGGVSPYQYSLNGGGNQSSGLFENLSAGTYTVTLTDANNYSIECAEVIISEPAECLISSDAINMEVICDGAGNTVELNNWLDDHGNAISSSPNCVWSHDFDGIYTRTCGEAATIVVTFILTNECGATSETTASFIIKDETPPVVSCGVLDVTEDCTGDDFTSASAAWNTANLTALANCVTDNCSDQSEITIESDYDTIIAAYTSNCADSGDILVTYTVSDDCGNIETVTGRLIVGDDEAPSFATCPILDVTEDCTGDDFTAASAAWNTANLVTLASCVTDNCNDQSEITIVSDYDAVIAAYTSNCADSGDISVTYTATDECGNSDSVIGRLIIGDDEAPSFATCAVLDVTEDCTGDDFTTASAAWNTANLAALAECVTDNCNDQSELTIVSDYDAVIAAYTSNCADSGDISVTYTATDECGNSDSVIGRLIIGDDEAPSFATCPILDVTEDCTGDDFTAASAAWNTANLVTLASCVTDNCNDQSEITIVSDYDAVIAAYTSNCADSGDISVTYTATDECGNSDSVIGRLIIGDDEAPSFATCAVLDVTEDCTGDDFTTASAAWNTANLAALAECVTDNCNDQSELTIVSDYDAVIAAYTSNCADSGDISVTYTATDECGNSDSVIGKINNRG